MKKQSLPLIALLFLLINPILGNTQDFKFELFSDKYLNNFDDVDPAPFGNKGVVATDHFYISLTNENAPNISKAWKDIKFQNTKFAQDGSFKDKHVWTNNDDIFLAIISKNAKLKEYQLLKCQFDSKLNLISEEIVERFPLDYVDQSSNKISGSEYDLIKMENSDYYLFSRISLIEKKGFKMEYTILNLDLKVISKGVLDLPQINVKETEDKYTAMKRVLNSSKILDEGDLVINVNDQLYLVGQNNIMKLDLDLEHNLSSYQIIQDVNKKIILIGSYIEGSGESKKSGVAIIRINNEDFSVTSQNYELLSDNFDLKTNELNRKLSGSKYNSVSNIAKPFVFRTKINENGNIKLAVFGLTEGFNDYGKFIGTENIDIITFNNKDEILQEVVIPKSNTKFEDNQVIFSEKNTLVLSKDYSHNYKSNLEYLPTFEEKKNNQLEPVYCTILIENVNGKWILKKI